MDYIELAHQRAMEKKTHVSFPQLKYPSLRDTGLKAPVQWLQGKSMDDGAEGFWRVHDGIYDLSDFIKIHPGGEEWLELTKGTDITEAFETHHLNPAVEKKLQQFYVREAKTPRNSPFTFKENGFYRTLKREVYEELKKVPKSVQKKADMILDSLLVTLLLSSGLACYLTNYWAVMTFYLIASLSLAWASVAAHNYIHKKASWRMYVFNASLISHRDFRISHALSHHLYTNTLMDLEVHGLEPLVFLTPRKFTGISKYGIITEQVLLPFCLILYFIKRITCNFVYEDFFTNHYRWSDLLGILLPVWMWFVSGSSWYDAFVMWLWILCTGSYIMMTIGFNAGHHHPDVFKDGDEVSDVTPDWGMHQLEALMDRKDINGNLFKTMTFFGDHILHHMFPSLDHSVLPYLNDVFQKHCERNKANFRLTSSLDCLIGQWRMILKTDPTPLEFKKSKFN